MLLNEREPCETCGSVIMDFTTYGPISNLTLIVFGYKLGPYRIIKTWNLDPDALYLHREKFISRKIK